MSAPSTNSPKGEKAGLGCLPSKRKSTLSIIVSELAWPLGLNFYLWIIMPLLNHLGRH